MEITNAEETIKILYNTKNMGLYFSSEVLRLYNCISKIMEDSFVPVEITRSYQINRTDNMCYSHIKERLIYQIIFMYYSCIFI